MGAAQGDNKTINVGVAAHITAAAPGGPRYDSSLTSDQRRNQSNGIWLCETHGKLVDSDSKHFTVEKLREWKLASEAESFRAILGRGDNVSYRGESAPGEVTDRALSERLFPEADLEDVAARIRSSALMDLTAFKRMPAWPHHAIALNLKMAKSNMPPFDVRRLATAMQTFNKIVLIAQPGTGKTTTLLQLVESVLLYQEPVAVFIPLNEWSSQSKTFFQFISRRESFDGVEKDLKYLAQNGQLILVMDGWNELSGASRIRADHELSGLQREYPGLGIVVSTRRQALDVPISGHIVEIDFLTDEQQLEIARSLRGSDGEALLDHAWRAQGIRDLLAIPLYLTALLGHAPDSTLPTTKEEVLRLFVDEQERASDKAEVLRSVLLGFHMQMLSAVAVETTTSGSTTITESRARKVVKREGDRLLAEGQLGKALEPMTVLDVLVDYHLLVRSSVKTGELSFQHQQFQEWYASFYVEEFIIAAQKNDESAKQKLMEEVLDLPFWEESILFACERLSRVDNSGIAAVGATILQTIGIAPMLAAEMIFRSSSDVWDLIKQRIIMFVEHWHVPGKVDRAVRFMISTGVSEFAPHIWPLVSNVNDQVQLRAFRAAPRFRPSVLGHDVEARIIALPEKVRENFIAEIAGESGMDGIELATRLAKTDSSTKVKVAAITTLYFRRADRFVAEILRASPDEVWRTIGQRGHIDAISDPDCASRLRLEWKRYFDTERDPLRRLGALIDSRGEDLSLEKEVMSLIEAAEFPIEKKESGWAIERAHERFPDKVLIALVHRLEAGLEIPSYNEKLLRTADLVIDEGPLISLMRHPEGYEKIVTAGASIVGPKTVGNLIEAMVETDKKSANDRIGKQKLSNWIFKTRPLSFVKAVLSRPPTEDLSEIALIASLVARHGDYQERGPFQVDPELFNQLADTLKRWADALLAAPSATRAQLADVAQAIERVPAPDLVPTLQKLLEADLERWRVAREKFMRESTRVIHIPSDSHMSWEPQYGRAFAAIGNNAVIEIMKAYLPNLSPYRFGVEAARVLKDIWQRKEYALGGNAPNFSFSQFAWTKARRMEQGGESKSAPMADDILSVVTDLAKPDAGEVAHRHAVKLANIAFTMPYGDRSDLIQVLLNLRLPVAEKNEILKVFASAGETIPADIVIDGISALLEEAKGKPWLLDQLGDWLILLPFSDRVLSILDALELLEPKQREPWKLGSLLIALGWTPSIEAERILEYLAKNDKRFLSQHDWLEAVYKQGSVTSVRLLLDLLSEGAFDSQSGIHYTLSRELASAVQRHVELRNEVYQRYKELSPGVGKEIIEDIIMQIADADGLLVLLQKYASENRPFDNHLYSMIRELVIAKRPSADLAGAYEMFSVPVPELRKMLFAMTVGDTPMARLAGECLVVIDELRDEYGSTESEPHHPDISSHRPWPPVGGLH